MRSYCNIHNVEEKTLGFALPKKTTMEDHREVLEEHVEESTEEDSEEIEGLVAADGKIYF